MVKEATLFKATNNYPWATELDDNVAPLFCFRTFLFVPWKTFGTQTEPWRTHGQTESAITLGILAFWSYSQGVYVQVPVGMPF